VVGGYRNGICEVVKGGWGGMHEAQGGGRGEDVW
jgi:hypothetical protein